MSDMDEKVILFGDPGDEQPTKTEHEWEYGGERYRVRWECAHEIVGWCLSVLSPGGKWYRQVYQESRAAAAAIARLAGLVRPEGGEGR